MLFPVGRLKCLYKKTPSGGLMYKNMSERFHSCFAYPRPL